MCSPTMLINTVSAVTSAATTTTKIIQEKKQAKDNLKIALMSAKREEDSAKREIQAGIDEARNAKLEAKQKANILNAQNASNGFDITNGNNLYNFENINLEGEQNALNIQNSYNLKAQNHYDNAKSYLKKISSSTASYNSSLFATALGLTKKVSENWYSNVTNNETKVGV